MTGILKKPDSRFYSESVLMLLLPRRYHSPYASQEKAADLARVCARR
jgi:hypothetical protein